MLTTKSRSPFSNCIFSSRVAHRVSKGFPLGVIFESEKMPTTLRYQYCSLKKVYTAKIESPTHGNVHMCNVTLRLRQSITVPKRDREWI